MKKYLPILLVLLLSQLRMTLLFGDEWDDFRDHEVILLTGQSMGQFVGLPIDQIFFYSYREKDNAWHQITFQIDQLDGNAGYFNGNNYNNIIDEIDEFLFMANEAGDYASLSSWINDDDSKQYVRNEIEIINPNDPLTKRYVYIYRSSMLSLDPGLPNYYVKYIDSGYADTIKTASYIEGHNGKGIPDLWLIADSTGTFGNDILDRQKARAKGTYKPFPFITISYNMTEDDLNVVKMEYKRGPIRIIRDITFKAEVSGISIDVGTFRYRYYPYQIESLGADKNLKSDYGVKLIRQSFDLDSTATGMFFNNPKNYDLMIDGMEDVVNDTIYPSPVMNWYMYSGDIGTVVVLNEVVPLSNATHKLYYHESLTNSTGDGTPNTGDNKSFGDVGILFVGDNLKGKISIPYFNYFLPGKNPLEYGSLLAYQAQNPLQRVHSWQNYITPAELAIFLPDTSGASQYPISIPVYVGNVSGLNILSSQLAIQFNSQILQATGVNVVNTLVENWDPPMVTISTDTIFVEMEGTTALQDNGVLVYLNFNVIGTQGQQSPLHFVQARFNTWSPLAVTDDGVFTTLPTPHVMVSLPDTTGDINTKISIPVEVDDITSLNITSYQMELSYSRVILDATSISLQGTLASDWSIVKLVDNPGYLTLEIAGTAQLQGQGVLVWINFDVIGSPGQSTSILFKKMQFNNGIPIAVTHNGKFAINNTTIKQITVTIPDSTLESGQSLHSPVLISQLLNAEINDYRMTLEFDSTVLAFKKIDLSGTLTKPWGPPTILTYPGKIQVNAVGDLPLNELGPLIIIDFDVIGPDGSNTTVHFSEMTFNSGTLTAMTKDGIITVQGVIPVELASFTAISQGNDVILRWTTITESNNSGFYLLRSSGLSPDWQTIAFLPGAGTTTVPQSYSFIDWHLNSGTWYYRLKQQDLDGQVQYSQIIEVNLLPTAFALYQNYPNPFNSSTMIKYELPVGEHQVRLMIYDLLGHQIQTLIDEENQQVGAYQISWDGRDNAGQVVASGVYFYQLQAGKQTMIRKMVMIE
jgi:hypothetical protein